jgi:N-methylhydantoinase B
VWDGTPGEPGGYLLRLPGEKEFKLMRGAHIPVPVGAEAIVRTGGGGGWGDPLARDPALVREDVREGLISARAARERYGVALDRKLAVNAPMTKALRERLRSARAAASKPRKKRIAKPKRAAPKAKARSGRR